MHESDQPEGTGAGAGDVFETTKWTHTPLFRQLMVSSCVWASYFQVGLAAGAPPVLAAQLRREVNRTEAFDDDAASWFNSAGFFMATLCVVLMAVLGEYLGRKLAFLLMCVTTFASFVVFFYATSFPLLILSQLLLGPLNGGSTTVCFMIFSEYISPKYRGVFATIKSASAYWAVWVANAIGTFFHWKCIAILGIVCAVFNTSLVLFWTESPYWLASKGKMRECRAAHRWLRGVDKSTERELESLIDSEIKRSRRNKGNTRFNTRFSAWLKKMSAPEFYQPILLCALLVITYHISGKFVLTIYSLDILKKISNSEATAYTQMMILDGIAVVGMYMGCVATRYLKRRTLLFCSEFIAIAFLFSISLYLYLIKLAIINENEYVTIFFLLGFSFSISCGSMIVINAIVAELLPLELRAFGAVLECVMSNSVKAISLKFAPLIFTTFGVHGSFLSFATGSLFCALLSFKYVPETKDKTLTQIESLFIDTKDSEFIEENELKLMIASGNVEKEK